MRHAAALQQALPRKADVFFTVVRRVVARAYARIAMPFRARRFRRLLTSQALHALQAPILPEDGDDAQDMSSLCAGMLMSLPPQGQQNGAKRLKHLESAVSKATAIVRAKVAGAIVLSQQRLGDWQRRVSEARGVLAAIPHFATLNPPHSLDWLTGNFMLRQKLKADAASIRTLTQRALLDFTFAGAIAALEASMVYLTLEPAFQGTSASSMLVAQSLVTSLVLIYLAHLARADGVLRVLALSCLIFFASALGILRAGIMTQSASAESWAIVVALALAGTWFAVLGARAFDRGVELAARARESSRELSEENRKIKAQLAGNEAHDKCMKDFHRREARQHESLREQLPREIEALESRMRSEAEYVWQLLRTEINEAMAALKPEINDAARQLARWQGEQ